LRVCWCGALSLTRGRICHLQVLLVLASAVIFGSESRGTRDHILLSQIRDFLSVASYDSQGYGGGIRTRLHTGLNELMNGLSFYNSRRTEERPLQPPVRVLVCSIRCHGNVLTNFCGINVREFRGNALISTSVFLATKCAVSEPLPSNGLPRPFVAMGTCVNSVATIALCRIRA
jgi:hypothetical protein